MRRVDRLAIVYKPENSQIPHFLNPHYVLELRYELLNSNLPKGRRQVNQWVLWIYA